jgi:hypothetical protein
MKEYPIYSTRGWCRPSRGAEYSGVSTKKFRERLEAGLPSVRLKVGERKTKDGVEPIYRVFCHFDWIDQWMLENSKAPNDSIAEVADEILEGIQ